MGFFRRLLGGDRSAGADALPATDHAGPARPADPARAADPVAPVDADATERAYELDVLREEQARLDDLAQRQLKYARYSWEPPRQGGDRRADDDDEAS